MKTISFVSIAVVGGLSGAAHANGFLLNEFDARAVGRGNASAATDTDASSIYYNVGGLAAAEGTQVTIGGSLIAPIASFTDANGVKTDSTTSPQFVPGIFVSSRVHDLVAVGIGFYTPFGLAVSWPASSPQADIVREEALHTFFITPSVGVNLGSYVPGLTVGGGIDIVPATVELQQDIFFGSDRGSAHLAATAVGIGGRLGVMYRPNSLRQLSLGAMWRSDVTESFSGNGHFDAPAQYRGQLPQDGPVTTSITLPQSITGGVGFRPRDGLELEANVVWTNWSKFKSLDINVPMPTGTGSMTISQPQGYTNTFSVRIGGEYVMPDLHLALRAGYIYDPTPIPAGYLNAQLPDKDRNDVCIGASYWLGKYVLHGGLLWVLPGSRETGTTAYMPEYKGSFDVQAIVASVSLSTQLR